MLKYVKNVNYFKAIKLSRFFEDKYLLVSLANFLPSSFPVFIFQFPVTSLFSLSL